jgi:hypothetical protein
MFFGVLESFELAQIKTEAIDGGRGDVLESHGTPWRGGRGGKKQRATGHAPWASAL